MKSCNEIIDDTDRIPSSALYIIANKTNIDIYTRLLIFFLLLCTVMYLTANINNKEFPKAE
jgi:hypothetical protein